LTGAHRADAPVYTTGGKQVQLTIAARKAGGNGRKIGGVSV
jgi:hypothetical protein